VPPDPADRQARALELHLAGATYDAIADALGYASRSGAYKAVQEALTQLGDSPQVGEAVGTEVARLDAMLVGLWSKARKGDVAAVDRVLRISERRMALLLLNTDTTPVTEGTPLDELRARREAAGRSDASAVPGSAGGKKRR
jgi:hypothetical protein